MIITLVGTLVYEPSTGKIPSGLGRRFQFRIIIVLLFSGSKTLARQIVLPDHQVARLENQVNIGNRVDIENEIINRSRKINVDLVHQDGRNLLRILMLKLLLMYKILMLNIPVSVHLLLNHLAPLEIHAITEVAVLTCKIPGGDPMTLHST